MPNADYNSNPDNGLLGDPSSTSSGLIVPKPKPNQYYIFAVDEPHRQNALHFQAKDQLMNLEIQYSIMIVWRKYS